MDPALRAAASGMRAQQTRTEVIANNLANVNTTGFKRSRAHFEDLLYQTVQGSAVIGMPENGTQPAIQIGRGTRLVGVQRLHAQGSMETTNRPLDMAIEGEGFFQVQLANGQSAYTRDGSFSIADQGVLVTAQGYPVGLQAMGENLYAATPDSGDAVTGFAKDEGFGRVVQGALESSNVEIVQEMVDMITAMRAYEINSKAIKNSEQMLEIANNLVR